MIQVGVNVYQTWSDKKPIAVHCRQVTIWRRNQARVNPYIGGDESSAGGIVNMAILQQPAPLQHVRLSISRSGRKS